MKTVLAFGDSLTWGADPATGLRHPVENRWPEVLEAARANPGGLVFSSSGVGSDATGSGSIASKIAGSASTTVGSAASTSSGAGSTDT